ncbi:MAG: hypothetical protein L0220_06340 [Acidobacteria bacterium]|nr:hypothetical protein [Acidobacteriota bacterium]
MNDLNNEDLAGEYLRLKAANDQLRERGKQWLWNALELICSEINRDLTASSSETPIQLGRQEWQFTVESMTMVGERFGARYRYRTLTIEAGWPRLPEHGYVKDNGLARGRIALSQNIMIDAQTIEELILKRQGNSDPAWFSLTNNIIGAQLTQHRLRTYIKDLVAVE